MPLPPTLTLSFPAPEIALLTFDTPEKSANILSASVLDELEAHLAELRSRDDLAGLIFLSGKPGTFIAGADLREFAASLGAPREEVIAMCRRGQQLFAQLAATPFVTIAAIDGVCVGGGAELAAWCDRRIVARQAKTQIGFPEVKLGLYPGWGGTVRAPRLVGLGNAVELITGGESIHAEEAHAMGLADDLVAPEQLLEAAIGLARREAESGAYRGDRARRAEPLTLSETELAFLGATSAAYIQQQTKGHYPAPLAALNTMLESVGQGVEESLEAEAAGMAELFGSPVNAALLNVFFLGDRNKKDPGVEGAGEPRSLRSLGVIGAGIMGSGIAAVSLRRGLSVALTDSRPEALEHAAPKVLEEAAYDKRRKGPDPHKAVHLAAHLDLTLEVERLAGCHLVLEAVVENLGVKRKLFAQLEPLLADDALLASNTSSLPITLLAEGLARPERFCGIHFFNPVRKMPLVEIIRGEQTSDATVAAAVAYAKQIGKSPIVVGDGPGFLVNRLLFPYMNEALMLLGEGIPLKEIERAATAFGMPMGPFELFDVVGLDTALYAGKTMHDAFPDRVATSPLLRKLVEAGRLGQKSGKGFYLHENRRRKGEHDPQLPQLLELPAPPEEKPDRAALQRRLILPMLLEATRALEEGIARNVRDIDLGLIYGIGFPPFEGGLLFWADRHGAARIVEWLQPLESLGPRYRATPLLAELADRGDTFYNL